MVPEKSLKNLKHLGERPDSKEIQSKGGIASGIVKKKKKKMREAMECLMSSKIAVKDIAKVLKEMGFEDDELNNQLAVAYSQVDKAIVQQDTKAAEFCRNTMGEKPNDKIENINVSMDSEEYKKLTVEELKKLAGD